eukprot:CAMPEP_0181464870 /NCGR_PEP_ID=MMETSP1110-20121109/35656_1 /TAXON_ID=174948 /ORGANISM="Symbiodinium sp., Strain CCMP421" /LENGTH=278 /DNA_ID=CAMNT_0023589619 /DNA_START=56 /DNA_END=892 /DNA_ORIENTATION=+
MSQPQVSNRLVVAQLNKTKMCIQFSKGLCRETSCRFAHSADELRQAPDLMKTAMCRAFARGLCLQEDCKFAHSEEELRVSPSVYKTQLCNFFARGRCKKGDRCRHAHGWQELRNFQVENISEETSASTSASSTPTKVPQHPVTPPPGLSRVLADISNTTTDFQTPEKAKRSSSDDDLTPMKVPLPDAGPAPRPERQASKPDSAAELAEAWYGRWQAAAAKSAQQRAHDVLRASAALQLAQAVRGGVDIKEVLALCAKSTELAPEASAAPKKSGRTWVV